MSLQDIQTELQRLAGQNNLTFAGFAAQVPSVAALIEEVPFISEALKAVQAGLTGTDPNQVLTVTATLDWGALTGVPVTVTVTPDSSSAGRYLTTVQFEMPPSTKLGIPGVDWFALSQFKLGGSTVPYALYSTGLTRAASISIGATLLIQNSSSQTPIPIQITDDPTGALQVRLNTSSIDLPSINDILVAFGDTSGINLPSSINSLLNFSLLDLYVGFQPDTSTITQIGVKIGNSSQAIDGWPIIPNVLSLASYTIDLNVLDPLKTRQIGGLIDAKAMLGTVDIEVAATHPPSGGWDFQGFIGKDTPVPIGDLIAGLGQQFGVILPAALHEFTLKDFTFEFNTETGNASGQFTVDFTIDNTAVELAVTAALQKQTTTYKPTITGKLVIGTAEFDVSFKDDTSKTFNAKWSDSQNPLEFSDIAKTFGWTDMPSVPENLDLGLTDAELFYDFDAKTLVLSAHSQHYGQVVFASIVPADTPRLYLFALDVPLNLELSDLPLIGPQLPSDIKLGVKDLEVIVSSAAVTAANLTALNALLATPLIPTSLNAGLTLSAEFEAGDSQQTFTLPLTSTSASTPAETQTSVSSPGGEAPLVVRASLTAPASPAPPYKAGTKWFTIGKSFGPVSFQRVGVLYQDSKLFFLIDAALSFTALTLAADGLGIGSPLTSFEPEAHLDGVSLSFSSGPVMIDGGFLIVPPPLPPGVTEEFMGEVVIAIEPYLIAGVAAYAKVNGDPSVFVFAQVTGEFGGPPAFFITGFMGGFGYNSQLTLPAADQVNTFPFIAGLDDPTIFGSAKPTPLGVLNALSGASGQTAWVTPTTGESWIAAGIMFRSFELVLGRALLVVTFGKDFEVALLGLASMSLPQGATTDAYAYVELQLEAVFKPNEGSFSIIASLTQNSFLLTRDCHLTGGFAFCLWFGSNAHAGDFVVTVGGYHPAFVVPAWYPQVAPVGFNWNVGGGVTVKGGAYFALTPTAAMAGGSLEVLYHSGDLKAWFTAWANIMVRWKPFYFTAGIGISIGASYRLNLLFTTVTVSVELGASLELWGPPTGGIVHIHWSIISFSVGFGADPIDPDQMTLGWSDFQALLPNKPQSTPEHAQPVHAMAMAVADTPVANSTSILLTANINSGLSRKDSSGTWIVRGDELSFTTQSAIPASSVQISGHALSLPEGAPTKINIRPMKQADVTSVHAVKLTFVDEKKDRDLTTWRPPVTQTANLPEALWGAPLHDDATPAPTAATIPGLQTGVSLTAPPATAGAVVGPLDPASLIDPLGGGFMPLVPATQADPIAAPVVDTNSITEITNSLASPNAIQFQQKLVTALAQVGAAPPTSAPLTQLAKQAGSLFSQAPLRTA